MRALIGLIGTTLAAFAITFYIADLKTAACASLLIVGLGLGADSLRK